MNENKAHDLFYLYMLGSAYNQLDPHIFRIFFYDHLGHIYKIVSFICFFKEH